MSNLYIRIVVLSIPVIFNSISAKAQQSKAEILDSLATALDATVEEHTINHKPVVDSMGSSSALEYIFSIDGYQSDEYKDKIEVLNSRQEVLQDDFGLDLEASYLENFSTGLFDVEGIFYKRRANVGLEWNILKNGWIDHHYELKALDKEKQNIHQISGGYVPDTYFKELEKRIDYAFREKKIDVLQSYLNLLNSREEISVALYHQDYLKWDAILALTSEKARIQRLLESAKQMNEEINIDNAESINYENLPVVDIHLRSLLEAAASQGVSGAPISELSVGDYHPLTDISLSASVQYNFYSNAPEEQLTGTTGKREFVSAGINISVPLPLQVEEKNDLVEAERRENERDIEKEKKEMRQKIYDLYEQYQQVLSEYERDLESYKLYNEQLRMQQTKEQLGDPSYSPRDIAEILSERYSKRLELLNNRREMYTDISQMYSLTYRTSVQEYVEPLNLVQSDNSFKDTGVESKYGKSIYIWSDSFKKYTNESLLSYIEQQDFDTIFLSAGPSPSFTKVDEFINQAHASGLSVEWMKGSNHLITPSSNSDLINEVLLAKKVNADGLHLDVEPQTFDDWEQNEELYKKRYLAMIETASEKAKQENLSLSISVPVYFDSIIPNLKKMVDNMQVMAYGTSDISEIKSRIEKEIDVAQEKISIALRPEDLRGGQNMDQFIEKLKNELPVLKYSIHDLEALLNHQNVTLNSDH